jgi:hypothetical protein
MMNEARMNEERKGNRMPHFIISISLFSSSSDVQRSSFPMNHFSRPSSNSIKSK